MKMMKSMVLVGLLAVASWAHAGVVEGKDYIKLPKPVVVKGPIEVAEFFSYHCVHCMHAEPYFVKWKATAPKDITIRKEQVVWADAMKPLAQLHYTMNVLKVPQKVRDAAYDAMVVKKVNLMESGAGQKFLKAQLPTTDPKSIDASFNSFGSSAYANQAATLTRSYNVQGTPVFIVDGKYAVNNVADWNQVFKVVNELIIKAKAERKP